MKLLLHACCGPCSLEPVRILAEAGHEITIAYLNSNIAPASEYEHRLKTLLEWAKSQNIPVIEGPYEPATWQNAVKQTWDGTQENRADRCRACYRIRLEELARYAHEHGFEGIGTTLTVSPYQYTDIINEELERAAAPYEGLSAVFQDFREFYPQATIRSRELGMYRQNYCGCAYSDAEAAAERAERKAARKAAKAKEKREKLMNMRTDDFDYDLPDERIAKYPLEERSASKLLVYERGEISERRFRDIGDILPEGTLLVFNNTKVIRARIIMHKPSGARIEVFCLEPHDPADYERAFAVKGSCRWSCIVGNLKKWKEGPLVIDFEYEGRAERMLAWREGEGGREQIVRFEWTADLTFGQLLEHLGRIPIPPYLNRESQEIDNTRYQTVYSKFEGSVAAPTAGLHFTPELIERMRTQGFSFEEVTLHVGAGTFLPVKDRDAAAHPMHTEHFEIRRSSVERLLEKWDNITAVGTTSVRTLESLTALAWRIRTSGAPDASRVIGQWELYDLPEVFTGREALQVLSDYMVREGIEKLKAATQIMITPLGYRFRIVRNIVTNFHQPKSTLLLLVSAYVGDDWHRIYDYALTHDFRFLSYGDSSVLMR